MLPSPEACAALPARMAKLAGFPDALKSYLREHGYLPESFASFFLGWDRARTAALRPARRAQP